MNARATNLALFFLLLLELVSGLGSFLAGSPEGRWVFWLHSAGGLSVVVLLVWKWRIVVSSFQRRGAGIWSLAPALLGVLFLGILVTGLWWLLVGRGTLLVPIYGEMRPLVLHTILGLALVPLFALHVLLRWPRRPAAAFASRRAVLRLLAVGGAGFALSRGLAAAAPHTGPDRRFTGSREEASFTGNDHPVTNWLGDNRQRIPADQWSLEVRGAVREPLTLGYDELIALAEGPRRATLDCTGGWYTVQDWGGVPLAAVLDRAVLTEDARSVVVTSATGFSRRFGLGTVPRLLLATTVGGERLSSGHGFPVRLVAPGRRGYNWVKWIVSIEVSERPGWWQSPLPTQ